MKKIIVLLFVLITGFACQAMIPAQHVIGNLAEALAAQNTERVHQILDAEFQNTLSREDFCKRFNQKQRDKILKSAAHFGHINGVQFFVETPRVVCDEELNVMIFAQMFGANIDQKKLAQKKKEAEDNALFSKQACYRAFVDAVKKNKKEIVELMAQGNWLETNSYNEKFVRLHAAIFAMRKRKTDMALLILKTHKNISANFLRQFLLEAVAYNCVDVVRKILSHYKIFVQGLLKKDEQRIKFYTLQNAVISGFKDTGLPQSSERSDLV